MKKAILQNSETPVMYDDADALLIEGMRWRLMRRTYKGKEWKYAVAPNGVRGNGVLMHRLISGARKGQHVDHINGDTLDNRRENLRVCSHSENMRNRAGSRFSISGIKGVSQSPSGGWRARIECDKKRFDLGVFDSRQKAAAAYRHAATRLHGRFARAA